MNLKWRTRWSNGGRPAFIHMINPEEYKILLCRNDNYELTTMMMIMMTMMMTVLMMRTMMMIALLS